MISMHTVSYALGVPGRPPSVHSNQHINVSFLSWRFSLRLVSTAGRGWSRWEDSLWCFITMRRKCYLISQQALVICLLSCWSREYGSFWLELMHDDNKLKLRLFLYFPSKAGELRFGSTWHQALLPRCFPLFFPSRLRIRIIKWLTDLFFFFSLIIESDWLI